MAANIHAVNSRETYCGVCGASLDNDFPTEQPCPECGELGRDVYLSAHDKLLLFDEIGDLGIEHGPPTWERRWRLLKHRLQRLREGYSPERPLNFEELEDAADSFFLASHSMFDWLHQDPSLPSITKPMVLSSVRASLPLEICEGYAITSKHMVPQTTRMQARIKSYHSAGTKVWLDIEYGLADQAKQTIDALELAEQCYEAWKVFLQQQGLSV